MTSHTFRFDSHQFQSRVRAAFEPRKPRNPLLRFALGLAGLALIVLLVMFGVVVGAAMLVAGLAYKLWHGRGKPIAERVEKRVHEPRVHDPRLVDAEYRVVEKTTLDR